ncbi:MAG: DEAD/DEAH box helicase, partial [Candidatus Nanoarchaeia archaeon]|nr:DEAD/DEAH box helicase [Candidatus Jingweiarchaeum tengchongense]
MVFKLLDERIQTWLRKNLGEPTLIQSVAIPKVMEGKNVLIIAPTGYGKTWAALLPIFNKIINEDGGGIKVLYITPLRSLNRDIFERIIKLGNEIGLEVDVRHGDTPSYIRKLQSESPPDVLITTPETLQSILVGKLIREHLRKVKYVIIDEIHEIAENKRGAQLSIALERLRELTKEEFQRIGIGATIGNPQKISKFLVGLGRDCEIVNIAETKKYSVTVEYPRISQEDKKIANELGISENASYCLRRIREELKKTGASLIFVNTREMAEILASRIKSWDKEIKIDIHHGSLSKEVRIKAEQALKKHEMNALICTSSLELGIDIGEIDFVIQYMSPRQVTKLMQRVGRSGHRTYLVSKGIILTQDLDDYLESLAIVKKMEENWLEEPKIPEKPYDVLAHQIIGFCFDQKDPSKEYVFNVVKRAYPYMELKIDEFEEVLRQMEILGLIRIRENKISRTKKALYHYFENLSMIPDEKQYLVIDEETNKAVGILHQGFVMQYISPGSVFIMKAEPWRVNDVKQDKIYVMRDKDYSGAIPSWEGELIPVPFEIASYASTIRNEKKDIPGLKEQMSFGIPDSRHILIEKYEDYLIIHACFGSNINNALAQVLSALISTKIGSSVMLKSDAYRIILRVPNTENLKIAEEVIRTLKHNWVKQILTSSLRNSSVYLFRFFNVARRFGIISKDADYTIGRLKRIEELFDGSIVQKEAFKEVFKDKMDIDGCERVVKEIEEGKIKITLSNKPIISPLGLLGFEYSGVTGFMRSSDAMKEMINLVKARISKKMISMFCMNCFKEIGIFQVGNIKEELKCPNCEAKLIGFVGERETLNARKVIKKYKNSEKMNEQERILLSRLRESAELFIVYGKKAIITLSA